MKEMGQAGRGLHFDTEASGYKAGENDNEYEDSLSSNSSEPKSPTEIIEELERLEARLAPRMTRQFQEYETGSPLPSSHLTR